MLKYIILLSISILLTLSSFSKSNEEEIKLSTLSNKGRLYMFWGWNRAWYTNSNIHLKGNNYDFTLSDVVAKDRQTPFALDPYFNIGMITIPQTNVRLGYFINDKIDLSFGYDHMKYVMVNHQVAKMNGTINNGSNYDGTYINKNIDVADDLLTFEHTDGLNYIDVEITRNDDLLKFLKITHNPNKITINTLLGFGGGFLLPRSNVMLLNGIRYDEFHLAGYGFSAKAGLDLIIFKHYFLRSEFKNGFIDMPSIRTSPDKTDIGSQTFFFSQLNFCFGFTFHPFN